MRLRSEDQLRQAKVDHPTPREAALRRSVACAPLAVASAPASRQVRGCDADTDAEGLTAERYSLKIVSEPRLTGRRCAQRISRIIYFRGFWATLFPERRVFPVFP